MRRSRGALALLAALAMGLALVGCGLPTDDEPQELSEDQVPFDLLAGPTTTVSTRPPGPGSQIVNLYFRDEERLVAVPKEVSDGGIGGPDPDTVIEALLTTSAEELDPGIRSAIPPDTELIGTRQSEDVLTIDLTESFTQVEGDLLIFAVAQVVYTATERAGIDSVRFAIDGERINVPDDDGVEQEGPVSPSDYLAIAPLPG